jgi:hypothetical protein
MTDCKHDWHFLPNTDRLQCRRCKAETGPRTYDQRVQDMLWDAKTLASPCSGYKLHDSRPNSIRFYSPSDTTTEVLRISKDGVWANPDVPCDEAAKKVLEALDSNIKSMIDRERQRLRDELVVMFMQAHEGAKDSHNHWHVAANKVKEHK